MPKLKRKELSAMSTEDLNVKLDQLRKELMKENLQVATGTTPKSSGKLKLTKKNIARILTVVHEKVKEKTEEE